jgi:O-antigen/teichoic acid export membrane protein
VKVVLALLVVFTPVGILFCLWGEPVFAFAFGEQWRAAGSYAAYLVLAAGMRFCVSPVSVVMLLEGNIRKGAAWQMLYFATLAATLLTFASKPVETLLLAFVVHEVLLYSFYLVLILLSSREPQALRREP